MYVQAFSAGWLISTVYLVASIRAVNVSFGATVRSCLFDQLGCQQALQLSFAISSAGTSFSFKEQIPAGTAFQDASGTPWQAQQDTTVAISTANLDTVCTTGMAGKTEVQRSYFTHPLKNIACVRSFTSDFQGDILQYLCTEAPWLL